MDLTLIFLVAISVLFTGVSKGGFSGAFGIIAVPLISLKVSPIHAAALMLPVLCLMDLFAVQSFWRKWDKLELIKCIPPAIFGVILAGLTADWFSESWLKILVGIVAIGFSINSWPRNKRRKPIKPLHYYSSIFWCSLGGFTSTIAHAGGPPLNVHLLRENLEKTRYVATAAAIFTVINFFKLIPYTLLGEFNLKTIFISLCFTPIAFLGVRIGVWLHYKMSSNLFFKFIYLFLFLTGLKLTWDGFSSLYYLIQV